MNFQDFLMILSCLALTVIVFYACKFGAKYFLLGKVPPIILSSVVIILLIEFTPLDYEGYGESTSLFTWLLMPATVAMAYPLYIYWHLIRKNALAIFTAVIVSVFTSLLSVYFIARQLGLEEVICASLISKSVTTPVAIEITKNLDGIFSITLCAVVITGTGGAMIGLGLLRLLGVKNDAAIGLSMGATSHVIGTAKCLEKSQLQGAYGALVLVLVGVFTAILAPIFIYIVSAS